MNREDLKAGEIVAGKDFLAVKFVNRKGAEFTNICRSPSGTDPLGGLDVLKLWASEKGVSLDGYPVFTTADTFD